MKRITVYSDASVKFRHVGISSVVMCDGIIKEQDSLYYQSRLGPRIHELKGIELSLKILDKYIKRNKVKDAMVQVFCDNVTSIEDAWTEDSIVSRLKDFSQRGVMVFINKVNPNCLGHTLCHNLANKFRESGGYINQQPSQNLLSQLEVEPIEDC